MTKHTIHSATTTFSTTEAGATWLLQAGSTIDTQNATGIKQTYADTVLDIYGKVSATDYGIDNEGTNSLVTIAQGAQALGGISGVFLDEGNASLDNHGKISSTEYAVLAKDGTHEITNSGTISSDSNNSSDIGVLFYGSAPAALEHGTLENSGFINGNRGVFLQNSDAHVVNDADGTIKSQFAAVSVYNLKGISVEIDNHGLIQGNAAIYGEGGSETIVNSGTINGDIYTGAGTDKLVLEAGSQINGNVDLGADADQLDLRHGMLGKSVFTGGDGDDLYMVASDGIAITEAKNGGTDTVMSGVTFHLGDNFEFLVLTGKADVDGFGNDAANLVYGNKGDNLLSGGKGSDTLYGMQGADQMKGGAGADTFIFGKGDGHDASVDFHAGQDHINLHYVGGLASLADVLAHAKAKGGDVLLDFGHGDVLTVEDVHLGSLKVSDFIF